MGLPQPGRNASVGDVNEAEGIKMIRAAWAIAFVLMPVLKDVAAAKAMIRPYYIDYVCGMKGGQPKTYFNAYFAKSDGATDIRLGRCEDQQYRR